MTGLDLCRGSFEASQLVGNARTTKSAVQDCERRHLFSGIDPEPENTAAHQQNAALDHRLGLIRLGETLECRFISLQTLNRVVDGEGDRRRRQHQERKNKRALFIKE